MRYALAFCSLGIIPMCLFFYTWYRLHTKLHLHSQNSSRPLPTGWQAKTEYVTNDDGQAIAYWYFPKEHSKATILLIHGYHNPGGKQLMLDHAKYLHDAGYSVALIDLRSHGESDGSRIYLGSREWNDVERVYDALRERVRETETIGFFGISMGAATALLTSGLTGKGDFLIASVPYASYTSLFRTQIRVAGFPESIIFPFMHRVAQLVLGKEYEQRSPIAVASTIRIPVLLISATQDVEADPQDAEKLFAAVSGPKELWKVDSPHDVYSIYPEEFESRVLKFLHTYVSYHP